VIGVYAKTANGAFSFNLAYSPLTVGDSSFFWRLRGRIFLVGSGILPLFIVLGLIVAREVLFLLFLILL